MNYEYKEYNTTVQDNLIAKVNEMKKDTIKEKCCGGKKCGKGKLTASEVVMKEDKDSLEKTTAELNQKMTEEEEREKIEELLRGTGTSNNR